MTHVTLGVTEASKRFAESTNESQRQIAIRDPSPDLLEAFSRARREKQVMVSVCGEFKLSVGDTSAIWAAHQSAGLQMEDFTSLYDLLARRPGTSVKFNW